MAEPGSGRRRPAVEATVRVLIALGGNAMTSPDGAARPADQKAAIEIAMESVADVLASGVQVVLTHGNGPQVGNLLVKNEVAAHVVPPVPLDWCVAQTQATIGVMIMDALEASLARRGMAGRAATLVSRTLVDGDDRHFAEPTKPIGRYLSEDEAARMIAAGQTWQDRGQRGWRRVVASPEPLAAVDAPAALALLDAGFVVVCSGGGGVPVVAAPDGSLHGAEAVIDKDLTAAVLAGQIGVDRLVIATDVDHVMTGFGTPAQQALGKVTVAELDQLAAAGEFASGSMGPKVDAACRFARAGGTAVITSLERIGDGVAGTAGTIVTS